MIFDVEKAFKDYFITNMASLTGNANTIVGIYRGKFPDSAKTDGVSVFAELPGNHESVSDLYPVGIRINVRNQKAGYAFKLMKNIDKLIDKRYHANLNDDVELCECKRNAGPDRLPGTNDNLAYFTALYITTCRYRGND